MEVLKKLQAPKGSLFGDIENDIVEEFNFSTVMTMLPGDIKEKIQEIKPIAEKLIKSMTEKLGDDKNIGIVRNVDGNIIFMLLKTSETDIDLKSEKTIVETVDVSALINGFLSL